MKKIAGIALVVLLSGVSLTSVAQDKDKTVGQEIKQGGHEIKKGAKKVGHKTAEVASKGKSRVVDQVYKDKTGPNGETIYIDNHSKYYWVDKKGHKQYITEAEMKNKNSYKQIVCVN
jgi:hypothetical protein